MIEDKTSLRCRNLIKIMNPLFIILALLIVIAQEALTHYNLAQIKLSLIICAAWSAFGRSIISAVLNIRAMGKNNEIIWRKDRDYLENKVYGIYALTGILVNLSIPIVTWRSLSGMTSAEEISEVGISLGIIAFATTLGTIVLGITTLVCSKIINRIDSAIKKLRKCSEADLSTMPIILVKSELSFDPSILNQIYINNKTMEKAVRQYLLEEAELNKILQGSINKDLLPELIYRWCYIVQIQSEEELKKYYDKIYSDRKDRVRGLESSVIVNYNPSGASLEQPKEYKNTSFIGYMEIKSPSEINFQSIWDCSGGKGNQALKENVKPDSFNEEQLQYYFQHPEVFLQRINSNNEYIIDYNGASAWLMDFYKNACIFKNQQRAIMAMLDYMELVLRLVAVNYYGKGPQSKETEDKLIEGNFSYLARFIINNSKSLPSGHKKLRHHEFANSPLLQMYLKNLQCYLYISFEGERVNFPGLISLIQVLRNKFVAHGVINEFNASTVWGILFYASVMFNNFLDINEFQLIEGEQGYKIGYGNDLVDGGKLLINKDGYPCIASMRKKNKANTIIYVNYFNGELILPDYFDMGDEDVPFELRE